jgi:signal transduction histidine kinase
MAVIRIYLLRLNEMVKNPQPYEENLRLQQLVDMQKRIIYILAHDIRSPLNSLKSLLHLMPEKNTGLSQKGMFLEMACNQLNGTLALLDNMVEWGQLQLCVEELPYKDCLLEEIVGQVQGDLGMLAAQKGLTLKNQVDSGIRIVSDENRLRFILRNLLTNAIKFTKNGFITVDAALTQKNILISVEDTGIGMPPAILENLFHGQKKVVRKGTLNEAGSGLGLSLVREFVETLKGALTVESEVGKGSVIAFSLPLSA